MKLSDYVFEFLAACGVKHVFMFPGGGCMHLVDSLGRCRGIEYVVNLHEQAAAIAAQAYGQYTGNLGVALVTTGPGGTNAITGVAGAWVESTPCLVISGQVKRADLLKERGVRSMGPQELDIVSVVSPITKYAVTIADPATIRYHLERAVYEANHGRPGPAWLDIPLDVQAAMVEPEQLAGFEPLGDDPAAGSVLAAEVHQAIELLNQAERPVVFAGYGIRAAKADHEFLRLADQLQAPVLTTWKAADVVPETYPLYAGRPGGTGQRGANFALQNADCLLILGARLDLPQTAFDHQNFARSAHKIVVDVDPAEIGKMQTDIAVPVAADVGAFVREMMAQSGKLAGQPRQSWLNWARERYLRYPVVLPEYRAETGHVNLYVLIDALSDAAAADDVFVPGSSGACSDVFMQAFRVQEGQRIVNAPGLGAMGFGLPGSVGACLASGRRRTICVNGDGGFQLNIQELETVRRLNLPIKYFVLNNTGYGSIRGMQRSHFQGRYVASDPGSGLTLPDIRRVAQAYDIPTARIEDHNEISDRVGDVLDTAGPIICEVMVPTDQPTAPRVSSRQREDGSMVSTPLEDMWPFLPRDEFLANMIVPPVEQ